MSLETDEERAEEEKKVGAVSALGKITQAGYSSLDVRVLLQALEPYIGADGACG